MSALYEPKEGEEGPKLAPHLNYIKRNRVEMEKSKISLMLPTSKVQDKALQSSLLHALCPMLTMEA